MHALRFESAAAFLPSRQHPATLVMEPESPWAAKGFTDLVPPATLAEARERRDELAHLLGHERAAAADFLLALADFDRRRGWERLGHASLFAFLTRELGLSNGAAWARSSAARLLPSFPSVEAALRAGRLCLSSVGELARVLTAENEAEVLPRFFGCSFREAKELVAAIRPDPRPPRRDVVTVVPTERARQSPVGLPATLDLGSPAPPWPAAAAVGAAPAPGPASGTSPGATTSAFRAHEVGNTHPDRGRADGVEPLTADLRRLSVTVSARFLEKLSRARTGLSHANPHATTEQVLEAALDLLLEKQARRKSLVKSPHEQRAGTPPATASTTAPVTVPAPAAVTATQVATPTGLGRTRAIPAAIEREVRLRDGDRCQFPLDAGGLCGSTWQVELDHVVPLALGGPTTVSGLRCACRIHNRYAAELALGAAVMAAPRRLRRRER